LQYKIPQNVGIEDKIVGPFTLRQLIIVAVGCGISYVLFAVMSKVYELNFLEYFLIVLPALIAIAFAMVKINNIPLIKFIFLFLEFSIKPKSRLWDHRGISSIVAPDLDETKKETVVSGEGSELDKKAKRAANLNDLTRTLDSGGFDHLRDVEHDDIDDTYDDDLVTQAYFGHKRNESETENMYWRTKDAHMKMLDAFAAMPTTKLKKGSVEAMQAQQEIAKVKKEVEEQTVKSALSPKTAQAKSTATATQTPTPKPAPKATPQPSTPTPTKHAQSTTTPATQAQPTATKKKPRKRKRPVPKPARKGSVNTTNKAKPAQIVPKTQSPKSKVQNPNSQAP
jgi:hypothetical protein